MQSCCRNMSNLKKRIVYISKIIAPKNKPYVYIRFVYFIRNKYAERRKTMVGLGDKLKELRKEKNLTQQQVADRINVSKAVISSYELSNRSPSYQTLVKIANLYKVSADYLLGMDERKVIDVTDLTAEQIELLEKLTLEFERSNKANDGELSKKKG